jgi:hypothetical protein
VQLVFSLQVVEQNLASTQSTSQLAVVQTGEQMLAKPQPSVDSDLFPASDAPALLGLVVGSLVLAAPPSPALMSAVSPPSR